MHPNKTFRIDDPAQLYAFVRGRGFGTLVAQTAGEMRGASVPFWVDEATGRLRFHLARSNALVAALNEGADVFLSVMGPDAYISPDWYGAEDQVPTWNYVAVHIQGRCTVLPDDVLPLLLDDLSAEFENRLAPKPPWKSDKVDPQKIQRMMRTIQAFEIDITSMEGTSKLSQNKDEASVMGAIAGLEGHDDANSSAIAGLMRNTFAKK